MSFDSNATQTTYSVMRTVLGSHVFCCDSLMIHTQRATFPQLGLTSYVSRYRMMDTKSLFYDLHVADHESISFSLYLCTENPYD